MSWSDACDTLELISKQSEHSGQQLISYTDSDTICIFIDNGKIVNSQGRVKSAITMDANVIFTDLDHKAQLESIWNTIRTLSQITEELELLRENCSVLSTKLNRVEGRVSNKSTPLLASLAAPCLLASPCKVLIIISVKG